MQNQSSHIRPIFHTLTSRQTMLSFSVLTLLVWLCGL